MVVSSVLHGSAVRGIGYSSKLCAYNNRAVFVNYLNLNDEVSYLGVPSTTSVSLLGNGYYYGFNNSVLYVSSASKAISNKKK